MTILTTQTFKFKILFFYLRFIFHSELCSASVRTYGDRVVRRNDSHLHGRTLRMNPQQEFLSRLKKRAAEDTITIPKIYDEELARLINEHSIEICNYLPTFSSIKSTLYRHRQRGQRNQTSKLIKTELNFDCKSSSINSTMNKPSSDLF